MAQLVYLASILVMGTVLLAVVYGISSRTATRASTARGGSSGRRSQEVQPATRYSGPDTESESFLTGVANDTRLWILGFVLLALLGGVGGVAFVAGVGGPVPGQLLLAGVVVVMAAYLFVGTYVTSKSRGRPAAQAVAEGCLVLGGALILTVVARLVIG